MEVFDLPCCGRQIKVEDGWDSTVYRYFCGFPYATRVASGRDRATYTKQRREATDSFLPRKKLIEAALLLEAINEASAEKSIRHGHPSTLHRGRAGPRRLAAP